jgi:pyruvate dehydrogenase E2 component (dihydrolipoamide acetyltransferase)
MAEFRMPSLGADMEAGTLVEWLVQPGDAVARGDIIAAVETEKGIIEIEVFEAGVVAELRVQPGERVPVGTVLAMIWSADRGAAVSQPAAAVEAPPKAPTPSPAAHRVPPLPQPAAPLAAAAGQRLRASPLARRLAAQHGIDLRSVPGTGPHGAIERADIERVLAAREPAAAAVEAAPATAARPPRRDFQAGMRRAIAAAMSRSNREIPHFYLETRIDMSRALRWLESENQRRAITERLLPVAVLLKAVAHALAAVPELNGYWIDDQLQPHSAVHIGLAIALRQGGLITPALHDVGQKSPGDIMAAMRDLITRARAGRLRSSEMTDATITVTNLGDLGVEKVYGVIYPPQVALVGFGKIIEQPWAENGMLGIRPVLTATLAADHRATDGRRGAQFLEALNRALQEVTTL